MTSEASHGILSRAGLCGDDRNQRVAVCVRTRSASGPVDVGEHRRDANTPARTTSIGPHHDGLSTR